MFSNEVDVQTSKAKIVDGALILSLSDALTPIVWRMGLDKLEDAAFQLVPDKGEYLLLVHVKDGQTRDIARYDSKEGGQKALLLATDALMSGGSTSSRAGNKSLIRNFAEFPVGNLMRWLFFFLLLFVVLFMIMGLFSAPTEIPQNDNTMQQQTSQSPEGQQTLTSPEEELRAGQAVDVDELFAQ